MIKVSNEPIGYTLFFSKKLGEAGRTKTPAGKYSESADPAGRAEEAAALPVEREVRPASPIGHDQKAIPRTSRSFQKAEFIYSLNPAPLGEPGFFSSFSNFIKKYR